MNNAIYTIGKNTLLNDCIFFLFNYILHTLCRVGLLGFGLYTINQCIHVRATCQGHGFLCELKVKTLGTPQCLDMFLVSFDLQNSIVLIEILNEVVD